MPSLPGSRPTLLAFRIARSLYSDLPKFEKNVPKWVQIFQLIAALRQ